MYNVALVNKVGEDIKFHTVYSNMNMQDAEKVADRMNRLNTLIARKMGVIMGALFVVVKGKQ